MRLILLTLGLILVSQVTFSATPLSLGSLKMGNKIEKNRITGPLTGIMGMSCPKDHSMMVYKYQNVSQSSSELGDSMLMAKYLVLSPRFNDRFFLSVAGGVKLPTGKTDLKDVYGNYLPWNIQTGQVKLNREI